MSSSSGTANFTFDVDADEDIANGESIQLNFNEVFENDITIPIKKYCLNSNGIDFDLCKYDAIVVWGDGTKSIISNQTESTETLDSFEIQIAQVKSIYTIQKIYIS